MQDRKNIAGALNMHSLDLVEIRVVDCMQAGDATVGWWLEDLKKVQS